MSGARSDPRNRPPARAQLSLLDRLIDEAPERREDPPLSVAETLGALRRSVRRDIEALLNARRRWRSWPRTLGQLSLSPLNFGIPDCTGGVFHDRTAREALRREIEDTIRLFEPRFRSVQVHLTEGEDQLDSTLRLRIEAFMHAEPAPVQVTFNTVVDAATSDVHVQAGDAS